MIKNLFLISALSLTLVACDRPDHKPAASTHTDTTATTNRADANRSDMNRVDNDNTGKNVRDRDERAKTSFNQGENDMDLTITQNIRQALVADDSLSTNAKNIKIVTMNGVVTLRGPVANAQEREAILRKVNSVQGIKKVENLLEVTRNNNQ